MGDRIQTGAPAADETAEPSTCPLCEAPLVPRWAPVIDPQTRETFTIRGCSGCGVGVTTPMPQDLGRYYGAEYYGEGKRHGITERFRFAQRVRHLQAARPHPGRVLDLGCGSGAFLLAAQQAGWQGIGTDRGEAAEIARSRGVEVQDCAADVPGSVDAVTAWHSLEHFPDPAAELHAARAKLASDGRLIVAVPDAGGWQARLHGRFGFALDVPRHLFHFDRGSLARLLDETGFEVLGFHHQEIEYDVFGWMQSTLNAVLPTPNLLFGRLTGAAVRGRRGEWPASLLAGALLFPPAVALTLASTAARRGGTLIAIARPKDATP